MGQHHRITLAWIAVASLAAPAQALDAQPALDATREAAVFVQYTIAQGYRAAPALMLGLIMLVAIPLVAFLSRVTAWWRRDVNATRRYRGKANADVSDAITGDENGLPGRAFVEIVGSSGASYAILRDMLRIGREDDNDIRIPSGAVHRYHAAIHREDLGDWHITDLSGIEGNGIAVNGQRCCDARLHDGDVIELGPGRLRFRASFA